MRRFAKAKQDSEARRLDMRSRGMAKNRLALQGQRKVWQRKGLVTLRIAERRHCCGTKSEATGSDGTAVKRYAAELQSVDVTGSGIEMKSAAMAGRWQHSIAKDWRSKDSTAMAQLWSAMTCEGNAWNRHAERRNSPAPQRRSEAKQSRAKAWRGQAGQGH